MISGSPKGQVVTMKKWCTKTLALVLACPLSLCAQTPPINGIAHIAFRVSNLDKALDFYHKLGFEESFAFTSGSRTTEVFVKVNDRQFIEVYPQSERPQPLGWMHVCYESNDLNALNALYVAHGLKPPAVAKAGAGNLIFSLHDPEGRVTEFTQYMPGSRHTLDQGKHLGANRVSEHLLGFDLPVSDLSAARQFFTAGLGFDAHDAKSGVQMSISTLPGARIEVHATKPGDRPETIFGVSDLKKTARQLAELGIRVNQQKHRVAIEDPDGNVLVFADEKAR